MPAPKTREPKGGWPTFFGIDHYDGGGKGMQEALAPALKPGARCFLEVTPNGLLATREQIRKGWVGPGSAGNYNYGTYVDLIRQLDEAGVKIIPLDRDSHINMAHGLNERVELNNLLASFVGGYKDLRQTVPVRRDAELHYYLTYLVRERGWRSGILRQATAEDLVVAHPVHIVRITRDLRVPPARIHYVDKVTQRGKIFLRHVLRRPRGGTPYLDELRVSDTARLDRFNARLLVKHRRISRLAAAKRRQAYEKIRREPTRIA